MYTVQSLRVLIFTCNFAMVSNGFKYIHTHTLDTADIYCDRLNIENSIHKIYFK